MKKLIAVILALCLAVSFAGCKKEGDDSGNTSSAVSEASGTESDDGDDEDDPGSFSINDDVETEEITIYTNSSKDYYWTPFDETDYIVDYATDEDGNVFFAQMDSVMQVVPFEEGSGVMIAVKNGGEKKKLKVTVIDGDDPENPPEKPDDNVVVETYDPSELKIPTSYYYKMVEKFSNGLVNNYISASTGVEYSFWTMQEGNDDSEFARYLDTKSNTVYDWDPEGGWIDQHYEDIDVNAELNSFKNGVYFLGGEFVNHFYGFKDVMKYKIGEEKVLGIDCYVFEQKVNDEHYYRYYVQPGTNVAIKTVECLPIYDGIHTLEMTSYAEYLSSLPTNINIKPSLL